MPEPSIVVTRSQHADADFPYEALFAEDLGSEEAPRGLGRNPDEAVGHLVRVAGRPCAVLFGDHDPSRDPE